MGSQVETRDWRSNRVNDVGEAFGVARGRVASSPQSLDRVADVGAALGRRSETARRSPDSGRLKAPPQGEPERRHEPRIRALDLVHVEEHSRSPVGDFKTEDSIGRTLDLSHDGMRLELFDHALPVGARVRLDLQLGNTLLRLEGRIRSVTELDARRHEHGVEFLDVTPEQYDALDAYLHLRGD